MLKFIYDYKISKDGILIKLKENLILDIIFNKLDLSLNFTIDDISKQWYKNEYKLGYYQPFSNLHPMIEKLLDTRIGKEILLKQYISVQKTCGSRTEAEYILDYYLN